MENDSFHRSPVTSAHCNFGTEKYPGTGLLLKYHDDKLSQGYGQIKQTFRALTEDDNLQPYKSDNDFRSSINGNDIG